MQQKSPTFDQEVISKRYSISKIDVSELNLPQRYLEISPSPSTTP